MSYWGWDFYTVTRIPHPASPALLRLLHRQAGTEELMLRTLQVAGSMPECYLESVLDGEQYFQVLIIMPVS